MIKLANAVLAIGGGVLGAMLLFWVLNKLVEMLPPKWEERLKPYVFIGPALSAIGLFLVFPAVQTVQGSFYNEDLSKPVGLANYISLFGDSSFRSTIVNTPPEARRAVAMRTTSSSVTWGLASSSET